MRQDPLTKSEQALIDQLCKSKTKQLEVEKQSNVGRPATRRRTVNARLYNAALNLIARKLVIQISRSDRHVDGWKISRVTIRLATRDGL